MAVLVIRGPQPGWYPDPRGSGETRWWDGSSWTSYLAPPVAYPRSEVFVDESTLARRARAALLVAAPAQVAAAIAMRSAFRDLVDGVRDVGDGAVTATPDFGTVSMFAAQLFGSVGTITGILFLLWFARSASNARALGLPARREPAAAVAGFIVPVINLWWPYQSTCDLLPDDRDNRALVRRWFLLWVVGGFVGSVASIASAFVDSWLGWALLVVPAVLVTLAALEARRVVSTVVETHEELARRTVSSVVSPQGSPSPGIMTDASPRYGPPRWPPAPVPRAVESNGFAIAALVCGIVGIPLFFLPVPALAAVILGVIGHRRARDLAGSIMADVGATLGILVIVGFGVLVALNFDDFANSTSLSSVRVGTCLEDVYPEDVVVRKACSKEHGSEVVAIVQHPAPPEAPYPKGFELNFEALAECRSPFEDYVGLPPLQSSSSTLYVQYPAEREWRLGARTIVCFAIGRDAEPLVGSVRGAG